MALTGLQAAWVVTVLLVDDDEEPLSPPQSLRATLGQVAGGQIPTTLTWDAPFSWGADAEGDGQRGYQRRIQRNDAGTDIDQLDWSHIQIQTGNPPATVNLPDESVWALQVRAVNKNGEQSAWASLTIRAREDNGRLYLRGQGGGRRYLALDGRHLRVA